MARPLAYESEQGYMYQILTKDVGERVWEHCDYAKDREELNYLLVEYRMSYGWNARFKVEPLPQKYWKEA